jgi:hypothetical protein
MTYRALASSSANSQRHVQDCLEERAILGIGRTKAHVSATREN